MTGNHRQQNQYTISESPKSTNTPPTTNPTDNRDGFLHALNLGYSTIPTSRRGKVPLLKNTLDQVDPDTGEILGRVETDTAGWKPYQTQRADAATIERWLRKWPRCNPATVTGRIGLGGVSHRAGRRQ